MPNERINTVDLVYARALLEMSRDSDQLDAIADELAQLGELLEANADLRRLIDSRVLSTEERAGALDRLFKGRVSDLLYRFVQVLSRKGRLAELPGVIRAFHKLYAESKGVIEADVYVAHLMDAAKLDQIAAAIGAALGKQVVPHQHEDASLIGGLKLKIGDRLIDGSVATQLRLLQQRMIKAGRDKALTAIAE